MSKNSGGSLDFNGQNNSEKHSRSSKQWDYNQSGLSPKTTGVATNHKGNSGGLADINASQASVGKGTKIPAKAASQVGRGPTKGNQQ